MADIDRIAAALQQGRPLQGTVQTVLSSSRVRVVTPSGAIEVEGTGLVAGDRVTVRNGRAERLTLGGNGARVFRV